MIFFKNWQKKKSKFFLIRNLKLLREVLEQLIGKISLSQIIFYDWFTYDDISKNINISLYIPEEINDGE